MTLSELKKTDWAKTFKKENPRDYDLALEIAQEENLEVIIHKTDETGNWQWAIAVGSFWLDSFKTKKEAKEMCKVMGWKAGEQP